MSAARRVVMLALAGFASAHAQNTDVSLGIEALARRDVRTAEAAFHRATTSRAQSVRSGGYQWLARLSWKVRGDTAAATRYLDSALAITRDSATILGERAAFEASRGAYAEAFEAAKLAMLRAADAERRGVAARSAVAISRARHKDDIRKGEPFAPDSGLRSIADTLRARVHRFPGRVVDAAALIDAATILHDAPMIREGLVSYFALTDPALSDRIANLSPMPIPALLREGGRPDTWNFPLYQRFLDDVDSVSEAYNRQVVAGRASAGELRRSIIGAERRFWKAQQVDSITEFSPAALAKQLRANFHVLLDYEQGIPEAVRIARIADVHPLATGSTARVVELDRVTANGFDAWLLDGAGGRAAWATRDTIYMIRDAFSEAPFRLWLGLGDPASMPAEVLRIYRDSIGDIDRAQTDSLGYFPGVAGRLLRDGGQAILDSLRSVPGLTIAEAQKAFVRLVYESLVQSSVRLHEGKHVSDIRSGTLGTDANAEFRAKVEEVSRADRPRLAMTAILTPNIGDASPHGQANRRVMAGLDRWIRRNGKAISGYDPRVTPLLQLPRLTDAQLRAAFNSMRSRN